MAWAFRRDMAHVRVLRKPACLSFLTSTTRQLLKPCVRSVAYTTLAFCAQSISGPQTLFAADRDVFNEFGPTLLHMFSPPLPPAFIKPSLQLLLCAQRQPMKAVPILMEAEASVKVTHGQQHPLYREVRDLLDQAVQDS